TTRFSARPRDLSTWALLFGCDQPIDGKVAAAADEKRQRHAEQGHWVFVSVPPRRVAAPIHEEAPLRVDGNGCVGHVGHEAERRDPREEAEQHPKCPEELRKSREVGKGGGHAGPSEVPDESMETRTVVHPEDLLRTVHPENVREA